MNTTGPFPPGLTATDPDPIWDRMRGFFVGCVAAASVGLGLSGCHHVDLAAFSNDPQHPNSSKQTITKSETGNLAVAKSDRRRSSKSHRSAANNPQTVQFAKREPRSLEASRSQTEGTQTKQRPETKVLHASAERSAGPSKRSIQSASFESGENNDQSSSRLHLPPSPDADSSETVLDQASLDELVALADTYHPRLTSAYEKVQAASGRAVQAGLYPNPKVAISSPQVDGTESQYNGFVTQEIVTANKLNLSQEAVQREVDQATQVWQQERFQVLTELRQKFMSTLAVQKRVEILQSLVQIAQRSRETATRLQAVAGEGIRSDLLLLDIEVQRAEVACRNAETQLRMSKRQLGFLVAVPNLRISHLSGDLDATTPNYDLDQVRDLAAAINPQANIARLEIDRAQTLLHRACVEPIPNVELMGGYQRQVGTPAENQGLFQVTMSFPLWNRNQGNISAAQAEIASARAELERVQLDLATAAATALANYETSRELASRYQAEIIPKARETLAVNQELYSEGQIDFLRLLQAQKTLRETELSQIDALEQQWLAVVQISGLLQEPNLP